MKIIAKCPACGCSWQLENSAADRRVKCPHCSRLFKVPKLEELPKATKMIQQAKGTIYVDQDGNTYG
jgi:hypothetical protein